MARFRPRLKLVRARRGLGALGTFAHANPAGVVLDGIDYGLQLKAEIDDRADAMDEGSEDMEQMGLELAEDREDVQQSIKDSTSSQEDEALKRYVQQQIATYRREEARERSQADKGKANAASRVSLGKKIGSWLGHAAELASFPLSALIGRGKGAALGAEAGEATANFVNKWVTDEPIAQHEQKADMLGAKIVEKQHALKQIDAERKKHLSEEAAMEDDLAQKGERAVRIERERSEYRRHVQRARAAEVDDEADELRRGQSLAKHITARTGAAAAARIAALAGDLQTGRPLVGRAHGSDELARIHATMKNQHAEAKSATAWHDLFTPKLRQGS